MKLDLRALICRIGALGDVLLTRRLTYSLALLGFRSTLFAPARHASLLAADPWIEGVLDSDASASSAVFSGDWPFAEARFDVAIVLSESKDLATAVHGAALRTLSLSPAPTRDDESIALQWAEAAGSIAPAFHGPLPSLDATKPRAVEGGPTFIHPGSGSRQKNWPIERFVELSAQLTSLGHRVRWIRGPAEQGLEIRDSRVRFLDPLPLAALASTLKDARLFVGNDAGVSHLAAAVGAPTVALFGPTNDVVWRPDGSCVTTLRDPSHRLEAIEVGDVVAASAALTRLRS